MKTALQAANSALSNLSSTPLPAAAPSRRLGGALLDNFWLRMASLYGHAWVCQYGPSPDGVGADTWSGVLADLAPAQIAAGMRAATALGGEFPPSAPHFRKLCLGIPSLASVRVRINTSKEPFMRLVWQNLDHYRFARADQVGADRMLADAYELAVGYVMGGGPMPLEPAAEIEHVKPVRAPASKQTADAAMNKLAAQFLPNRDAG